MNNMIIAITNDSHFGVRGDNLNMMQYFKKFYDKVFFPTLDKHGIKTVVHLGDITDRRKYINFNILHLFRKCFVDPLTERGIDIHAIIGNHDSFYKNTTKVNAFTELFQGNENFTVYTDPTLVNFDGLDVGLVPWITMENEEETREFIMKVKAQILFGHLEINGFEIIPGVISREGFKQEYFKRFDMVFSGHYHRKMHQGNIDYLGAPYEMTWADYSDRRGFHLFDTDTRKLQFIENPYKVFHKITYDDTHNDYESFVADEYSGCYVKVVVINKTNPYYFEKFLDKLYDADLSDLKIVEDIDYELIDEESLDLGKTTQELLHDYIDELSIPEDKERIKKLMSTLYIEAQDVEVL
jgi:DNA repair exonuclease SbcCD nuclease subunit